MDGFSEELTRERPFLASDLGIHVEEESSCTVGLSPDSKLGISFSTGEARREMLEGGHEYHRLGRIPR